MCGCCQTAFISSPAGVYTKTLEYGDINYSAFRPPRIRQPFSVAQWLNYFDSSLPFSFPLSTAAAARSRYKVNISKTDDPSSSVRTEYTRGC